MSKNQSLKATAKLIERALAIGCKTEIIEKSKAHHRRPSSLGSTSVPQKVIEIDDIRFSVGGAKTYLKKHEGFYKEFGEDTVSGIVCSNCGDTLPEMRAVDHLKKSFPLNLCPHKEE